MILKSPINQENNYLDVIYTNSAREAWKVILDYFKNKLNKEINVLLPSYIGITDREGSGIFDPVEQTKVQYNFYKLGDDLSVDIDDLSNNIKEESLNILLVVHYFGFCRTNMPYVQSFCQKNNIILVEDCAHAFHLGLNFDEQKLGIWSDFSFYSVHKYLSVSSGGILRINNKKYSDIKNDRNTTMHLDVLEKLFKADYYNINNIRRQNFELYTSLLQNTIGIEIMYKLDDSDIPQSFPILIKNNLREKLYFYLMEKQIPTIALYYRLIDEIKTNEKYKNTHSISNQILNLPLHQDTTSEDIEIISSAIKQFLT